ncbi:LmbU family transcriptional regulator [Streptomyces sp. NPDC015032]|uniref:LmbU family transcriptional regulator n=1 Tax=Streptomyces sp. NPDC015032 TaxID=3364937 RepID=UPI0036F66DA0
MSNNVYKSVTVRGRNDTVSTTRPAQERLGVGSRAITKRVMLSMPEGMTIDEWRNLGRQIHVISDSSAWWLGDWLIFGQSNYPNRYKKAIADTSLDYQTLRNYAWVARRFTPERRRAKLSFQHHAEVTSLPEAEQESWLTQTELHGWSRNELRRRIRDSREIGDGGKAVVRVQLDLMDQQKQRWQRAAESADQDLLAWMVAVLDGAATAVVDVN